MFMYGNQQTHTSINMDTNMDFVMVPDALGKNSIICITSVGNIWFFHSKEC